MVGRSLGDTANERDATPVDGAVLWLGEPLTEQVLDRLEGRRPAWIAAWAGSAIATPLVLLSILWLFGRPLPPSTEPTLFRAGPEADVFLPQVVLAYAIAVALWGTGRLVRVARALEPTLRRLTASDRPTRLAPTTANVIVPLGLSVVVALVNNAGSWERYGPLIALFLLPLLFIAVVPLITFVWTFVIVLVGLDRLGRARLELDPFPQDRSLGLGPVGALAYTGFVILFAFAIPILLTNTTDLSDPALIVDLVVVIASVPLFFLSMWRLHRQMSEAKATYVARTRALYAAAYEPLRDDPGVETLQAQAPALSAAQALAERADKILEWPISERLTAVLGVIVVGVITSLLVRFIIVGVGI
ncbi:MAG: hypothetical protein ACJ761_00805 [Chloroflexota bacterium]